MKIPEKLQFWRRWSNTRKARWIGYAITAFTILAAVADLGEGVSLRSLDLLFYLRGEIPATAPVVIVAIDNESFDEMTESSGRWPWPRSTHGKVINQIMKGKPKVIVFDVLFTEEDTKHPLEDPALAAACRKAGCVILGAELVHVVDRAFESDELKLPIKILRNAILEPGLVNTPQDSDAFVRRAQLYKKIHEERYYSLAAEALRKYLGVGRGEINTELGRMEFGPDRVIPLDSREMMLINYCGGAKTFKTIPYYQVYKGMTDPQVFKDAIVFVGATAIDLHDTFHVPFSWTPLAEDRMAGQMPGVEIHANVIDTILNKRFIREPWDIFTLGLILGLGVLVSSVAIRARIWLSLLVAAGAAVGLLVLSVWLFASQAIFLNFVYPLAAIGANFLVVTTYRASVEMREKQKVRATFARYVSPHVLTTVLNNPPELGGARRVATVLFSDVRGFTSMSEKLTAHEVVEILNEYLTEMVEVVLAHDGTLDKFVGDAVMAVFGSPMDQSDHALRAVSTAWTMHIKHEALKVKWVNEGKTPFEIGIGVNTGEVVAGNMGSPNRMEFTVIGDNVNTAARLESATKEAHCKILISASTLEQVKDHVQVKELDPIMVKGKAQPIPVYQLLGVSAEAQARMLVGVSTHRAGAQ
ncbi:MAG: adenylate/guanylate cyclase domain-containing protein [Candidatus Coatesbacteria bacterium]